MNEKVWKRKRSLRQESRSPVTKPASQSDWHTDQTPWSVRRSADSGRVPPKPPESHGARGAVGRAVEMRWGGRACGLTTLTVLVENMLGDCRGSGGGGAGGGLGRGGLMPPGASSELLTLVLTPPALRQDCRHSEPRRRALVPGRPPRNCASKPRWRHGCSDPAAHLPQSPLCPFRGGGWSRAWRLSLPCSLLQAGGGRHSR